MTTTSFRSLVIAISVSSLVAAALPTVGLAAESTLSAGCGSSATGPEPIRGTIDSAGLDRSWVGQVPMAHDGSTPLPVVIQLHGYQGDPGFMESLSGFSDLGEEVGFVTISPNGRGIIERSEDRVAAVAPVSGFLDFAGDCILD